VRTTMYLNALLSCGIAAAALFIVINVLAGSLWAGRAPGHGYDYVSQSIDELGAIGSPTRVLATTMSTVYCLLTIAFGIGIWLLGERNGALRLIAGLLTACALLGLAAAIFFPMRIGQNIRASDNISHTIPMAVGLICTLAAIGAGAAAFDNWFRYYSLATLALFAVLTILGVFLVPRLEAAPIVRIGIQERTMMFFILLWVVLLALELWR
jgi:hypothetical protein